MRAMRMLVLIGVASSLVGSAQAQIVDVDEDTVFIEGHVFNKRTGVPLAGASVTLPDPCFVCAHLPVPVELVTDANGFFGTAYQPQPPSPGLTIAVTASCVGRGGVYSGEIEIILRPGTIRRDLYLDVPARLSRCRPTEPPR